MAWSIPTYDGVAAHGRPSNLRVAMFELIRGIDERVQAYSGEPSAYGWWTAASSSASQLAPTFDDLEFLKCTGNKSGGTAANANKAYRNMELIRDRIRSQLTLGRFFTASGGDTAYTIASMETAIGRGLDLPVSVTEASWWQAMQDALDRMIYCRKPITQTGNGTLTSTHSFIADTFPDASDNYLKSTAGGGIDESEDSWDNRAAESGPIAAFTIINPNSLGWFARSHQFSFGGFPTFVFAWYLSHQINSQIIGATFETSSASGTMVAAKFVCSISVTNSAVSSLDVSLAGTVATIGTSSTDVYIDETLITLGTDTDFDFLVDSTEPSTNPFTGISGDIGFGISQFIIYFDISSELTDQA